MMISYMTFSFFFYLEPIISPYLAFSGQALIELGEGSKSRSQKMYVWYK